MSKTTNRKKPAAKEKSTAKPTLWIAAAGVLLLAAVIISSAIGNRDPAADDAGDPVYTDRDPAADDAGDPVYTDRDPAEGAGDPVSADQGPEKAAGDPVYADIVIEGYGTITISLDPEAAPETVNNFISLSESGFYDGLTFHRIIEGFMMQGGDPEGNGFGGSETTITGEFASNGYDNPLSHVRGTVSMARANDPNSASSQFFIVHQDSAFLDGNYAAFGTVASGMEIVDQICADAEPIDDNGLIAPDAQPVITSITIRS